MTRDATLVRCDGPRPSLNVIVAELWGRDADVDSDGNSNSPDDQLWTELTLENRAISGSRIDVDPVSELPLVLKVQADNEELRNRLVALLVRLSGGSVLA
jgi:hypothetical protein